MSNNGWGHALAAAVGGYRLGQRMVEDKEASDEDKAWKKQQRERQTKEWADADKLNADLKAAGQPIALTQGAGDMVRPESMDNRDVALPENAALPNGGLLPAGYRVADQTFTDKPAAEAAVAKHNAPEAVNNRVVAAYRGAGQHDKATQVESNARAAEVQKMQLADARWKRDLGAAMRGGHAGLAALATNSEAGPMAGMKVQLVPTADGKVTYGAVGPDGNVAAIPGLPSFTNDQDGVTRAAWMLDQSITPEMRMAHLTAEEVRAQKTKDDDRNFRLREDQAREQSRHNKATESLQGQSIAARVGGGTAKPGDSPSFDPLSDFDPKQARKAAMDQAIEEAKNNPGKDGAPVSEKQIAARAQAIYGGLRDAAAADNAAKQRSTVFATAARKAKTPEEVAELRERAAKSGYTAEEMAGIDPRFAAPKENTSVRPPIALSAPRVAQQPVASVPSPTDDPGMRVDHARTALSAALAERAPGLASGRTAIDAYAAKVQAARQAVAVAEAEYQRALPNAGAAFVSPSK